MSERDAVALAWAILVSLAIAGAVPASWAIIGFPLVYGLAAVANAFLAGMWREAVRQEFVRSKGPRLVLNTARQRRG